MNTLRIIHREKMGQSVYVGFGFIGLGMLDYSSKLAEYVMDTYLSEPDNTDFAFVAHGSLVPTQFYLYYEILNQADAKERENLKKYYPMFYVTIVIWLAGRKDPQCQDLEMVF